MANSSVPGGALVNLIRERAAAEGRDNHWLSNMIDKSYPYTNSILTGSRPIGALPRKNLKMISDWLGLPLVQIFLLAEILQQEDFFIETSLDDNLMEVFKHMESDVNWRGLTPSKEEWEASPLRVRLALAVMYEKVLGQNLIEKASLIEITD